jgi:phosphotriesterase-related protein
MAESKSIGKVQTVLGLIDTNSLGITLMHEHLLADLSIFFMEPEDASSRELAYQPVTIENLHFVRYKCNLNLDNLKMTDENLAIKEAMYFKLAGGNTIVEMSSIGLARDPLGLARISRATGLNVVMGTGFYLGVSQSPDTRALKEDEMTKILVRDIKEGANDTGIKAGIIGEVGVMAPIEDFEKRSLRAAAAAQQETGAMINVHPSHPVVQEDLVLENVKILKEAGANLNHVVMDHMDCMEFSSEIIHKLLDMGCTVEYDTFGMEGLYTPYFGIPQNTPTDKQRILDIMKWIDKGYIDQITISTDRCNKHLLRAYGGGGYEHILRNDVPLMRHLGMTEEQINTLLVENPKRLLPFRK